MVIFDETFCIIKQLSNLLRQTHLPFQDHLFGRLNFLIFYSADEQRQYFRETTAPCLQSSDHQPILHSMTKMGNLIILKTNQKPLFSNISFAQHVKDIF